MTNQRPSGLIAAVPTGPWWPLKPHPPIVLGLAQRLLGSRGDLQVRNAVVPRYINRLDRQEEAELGGFLQKVL